MADTLVPQSWICLVHNAPSEDLEQAASQLCLQRPEEIMRVRFLSEYAWIAMSANEIPYSIFLYAIEASSICFDDIELYVTSQKICGSTENL